MADLQYSQPKPQPFPAKPVGQANSFTQYFSKFLFLALFLVAIPLFPAQAPDLINRSLLTNFWELVHLLFVGVAVSYGLFCRRNFDMEIDSHSSSDDSQSFVSRILGASSIFEDGYYNSCGNNSSFSYKSESMTGPTDEQRKSMSFAYGSGINSNNRSGYGENSVTQAWNSQCFQGESVVMVAQPNYDALDGYGESGSVSGHKPLGLPVRSLRSSVTDHDGSEICTGKESSNSVLNDSSKSASDVSMNENFGDVGPINLEDKFNETAAKSSSPPISWRSRSSVGVGVSRPSHFRPLSVDETQLELLKSSLWSSESFSSQASSNSDSPKMEDLKMEELGKGKSFFESYPPASPTADEGNDGKSSFNAFHLRRYGTNGSLFEKKPERSLEDESKKASFGRSRKDDIMGCKEWMMDSLKFNASPVNVVKTSSRGKSVRTIRARKFAAETAKVGEKRDKHENHLFDKIGKASDEVEALFKCKSEKKYGEFDSLETGTRKNKDLDNNVTMPKLAFSKYQKRKHNEHSDNISIKSREESESEAEAEKSRVSSDGEAENNGGNDVGPNTNEVDKKASEFIAKFREQIRLQKVASAEKSRRRNVAVNSFR